MHLIIAYIACPGLASFTFPYLATTLERHMIRFDPFTTMMAWAVDTMATSVFLELLIKELVDMLKRNVLRDIAFWQHVGRISDRYGEDAAQTRVTYLMSGCQFRILYN